LARDLRHVLAGTEIEPTQRLSVRPPPAPALAIPDLDIPAPPKRAAPAKPAAATLSGPTPGFELRQTELSPAAPPRVPSAPELPVAAPAPQPPIAPMPIAQQPIAKPARESGPMPGVMLAPPSQAQARRAAPPAWEARARAAPTADMSVLVGWAAV